MSIIQQTQANGQNIKKFFLCSLLTIACVFLLTGCPKVSTLRPVTDPQKIPKVKVLIHKSKTGLSLSSFETFQIYDATTLKVVDSVMMNDRLSVVRDSGNFLRLKFPDKEISGYARLALSSRNAKNRFTVNDRQYRGTILITQIDGEIAAINILDLEAYVKGVVRNEIGKLRLEQLEAAKAQAVAARTYAVRNIGKTKREFDLVSDVNDQVYQGAGSETDVTNRAVDETSGEILEYKGQPAQVFYFSTCGGTTANVQDVWRSSDTIPYLQTVSNKGGADYYCKDSPYHRWSVSWTGQEIEDIVKTNLPVILKKDLPDEDFSKLSGQRLYNIAVQERDESQRVKKLKIGFSRDSYIISGEQARRVLKGPKYIFFSSLFRIDIERNADGTIKKAACTGAGFGHGVGMCQWSAIKMAAEGFTYQDILNFFYRSVKINRMY